MATQFTPETHKLMEKMGATVSFSFQSPSGDGSFPGSISTHVIDLTTGEQFHCEKLPYGTPEDEAALVAVKNSVNKPKPKTKAQAYAYQLEQQLEESQKRIAELEASVAASSKAPKKTGGTAEPATNK